MADRRSPGRRAGCRNRGGAATDPPGTGTPTVPTASRTLLTARTAASGIPAGHSRWPGARQSRCGGQSAGAAASPAGRGRRLARRRRRQRRGARGAGRARPVPAGKHTEDPDRARRAASAATGPAGDGQRRGRAGRRDPGRPRAGHDLQRRRAGHRHDRRKWQRRGHRARRGRRRYRGHGHADEPDRRGSGRARHPRRGSHRPGRPRPGHISIRSCPVGPGRSHQPRGEGVPDDPAGDGPWPGRRVLRDPEPQRPARFLPGDDRRQERLHRRGGRHLHRRGPARQPHTHRHHVAGCARVRRRRPRPVRLGVRTRRLDRRGRAADGQGRHGGTRRTRGPRGPRDRQRAGTGRCRSQQGRRPERSGPVRGQHGRTWHGGGVQRRSHRRPGHLDRHRGDAARHGADPAPAASCAAAIPGHRHAARDGGAACGDAGSARVRGRGHGIADRARPARASTAR